MSRRPASPAPSEKSAPQNAKAKKSFPLRFTKGTALRLIALVLVVSVVWCYTWDRWPGNWSVPVDYQEDSLMVLGWIKAAADGDFVPFLSKNIHQLGAPYVGNWNDWPIWGEELIFAIGLLAKWVGLFSAANWGVLLGHLSTALAFYFCCRLLRFRWEWSFVGAVLFAFTYFHTYRSLHHLLHTYSHTVPLALLSSWLVGFSRRMRLGDWRSWLCLGTAALMGLSNPYNLNIFAQLLCLSIAVQFLTQRRKANLQTGLISLAVIVVCFLAINLDTFSYQWAHGKNADALRRGYYETELFALKPIEFIVPPTTHHSGTLAEIGSKYMNAAWIKGEIFSPYLGVIGLAGLLWMFWEGFALIAKIKRGPRRFPAYVPQTLWVLFYSVVGGLNCVIALAGLPLFRGSNRYSIFISALILFFLVSRISWLTRRWQPVSRFALAAVVMLVGLWDQLPLQSPPAEAAAIAQTIQTDRAFVAAMEEKLPPKAMVFQLPVMPYPEASPVNNLQAYELLRPYFFSKTLRFSFGSHKGRSRDDWQKEVEKLPAAQMAEVVERFGFAAIYLNRKGFADQGEGLIKQLAASGRSQIIQDESHEQVCVFLHPSDKPELPPAEIHAPFTLESGWRTSVNTPNGAQHWTIGNAELSFFNSDKDYKPYSFTSQIGSVTPRSASIEINGKELWRGNLGGGQLVPVSFVFDAKPGKNIVRFKTDLKPRPSKYDPMPRAIAVVNPVLTRADKGH